MSELSVVEVAVPLPIEETFDYALGDGERAEIAAGNDDATFDRDVVCEVHHREGDRHDPRDRDPPGTRHAPGGGPGGGAPCGG